MSKSMSMRIDNENEKVRGIKNENIYPCELTVSNDPKATILEATRTGHQLTLTLPKMFQFNKTSFMSISKLFKLYLRTKSIWPRWIYIYFTKWFKWDSETCFDCEKKTTTKSTTVNYSIIELSYLRTDQVDKGLTSTRRLTSRYVSDWKSAKPQYSSKNAQWT